ncbi:MAG: phosphosulfolactate phosphohydrolase, partial [Microterricola sp.]
MTSAPHTDPAAQSKYQVRFDWGVVGAERIADGADVVVVVDVLGADWRAAQRLPVGEHAASQRQQDALLAVLPPQAAVLSAGFTTASAAARWITERQHALGRRAMIAIVAAGGASGTGGAAGAEAPGIRFAVENQLAAGAIIDALASLGTDYCSPEAAASCAAFTGLRGAVA